MPNANYTIVGVIGHIDHGKTSLVAALTGVDTDTHPEEKRRGITIDLGFASFTSGDRQFALIDAPGHQKYIGNLLAGVSAIDIGLLVVACDQGIQAQTLEHAAILQTLGVPNLVVALSRIDLADQAAQDELRAELEIFLDDFGFRDVPMLPISAPQKVGIEELTQQLSEIAQTLPGRDPGQFFRMPVDRVFTIEGRGTVVAGTVWSGQIKIGDTLQLAKSGQEVRVREIEVHGEDVEESRCGQRTALNITGVSASELQRGDELLHPQAYPQSRHLLMEIQTFKSTPELKCPATVQLHLAATSCEARITGVRKLQASTSVVVLVEAELPLPASFGQRCLLRLPYPVGTVAGATVLAVIDDASKRTRKLIEFGEQLAMADTEDRLRTWIDFEQFVTISDELFELRLGLSPADGKAALQLLIEENYVRFDKRKKTAMAMSAVKRVCEQTLKHLTTQAEANNDAWVIEESLRHRLEGYAAAEVIAAALEQAITDGRLVRLGKMVAVGTGENALSRKQQKRMELLIASYDGVRTPPSLKAVAEQLQLQPDAATSLSRFAVQMGLLIDCGDGLLLSAAEFQKLCDDLKRLFAESPECAVSDIRDCWGVTRKHAIPFLEYCDANGVTVRSGEVRIAGPAIS